MIPDTFSRTLPIGAEYVDGAVHFRVWAPKRKKVEVVFEEGDKTLLLKDEGSGYFSGVTDKVDSGDFYRFRLDDEKKLYPDPASRFQPEGPHGPSAIIDSKAFAWQDNAWKGVVPEDVVLYEMHIGTFTQEGTWNAAAKELKRLAELGVTCIEMMPVAEFPGGFNWGYDGVCFFAPTRNYGTPDELRAFIDEAHRNDIGVILDVVYNHIGPDGSYIEQFTDTFFSTTHSTDWGTAINFDGRGCEGVREFYLSNVRYWLEEFHFDGFRFDATQNIYDDSNEHILKAISRVARNVAQERKIF